MPEIRKERSDSPPKAYKLAPCFLPTDADQCHLVAKRETDDRLSYRLQLLGQHTTQVCHYWAARYTRCRSWNRNLQRSCDFGRRLADRRKQGIRRLRTWYPVLHPAPAQIRHRRRPLWRWGKTSSWALPCRLGGPSLARYLCRWQHRKPRSGPSLHGKTYRHSACARKSKKRIPRFPGTHCGSGMQNFLSAHICSGRTRGEFQKQRQTRRLLDQLRLQLD